MFIELKKADYQFIQNKVPSFDEEYGGGAPTITEEIVLYPAADDKAIAEFETVLNFCIVHDGMDNQDTVNDIGTRLYQIYESFVVIED